MKKPLKIILPALLLAVVLFAAVPKYYVHSFLEHHHSFVNHSSDEASVSSNDDTRDCTFETFDTPVYYTVFKFIVNFLPLSATQDVTAVSIRNSVTRIPQASPPLRGPPVS